MPLATLVKTVKTLSPHPRTLWLRYTKGVSVVRQRSSAAQP